MLNFKCNFYFIYETFFLKNQAKSNYFSFTLKILNIMMPNLCENEKSSGVSSEHVFELNKIRIVILTILRANTSKLHPLHTFQFVF